MLRRLSIANYALIDSLDISFPGNLVIITGETGAGKSILLGALSLLLGSKADVSHLGDKGRNCVVEGEFVTEEGNETILRRVISPQGRSRSFVDDEPVTLDELRRIASSLVDIHSQNQQLLLADSRFQRSVLDLFAGIADQVESFSASYDALQECKARMAELDRRIAENARNRDYVAFQLQQLEAARLVDGELESLEAEQKQLAHSEQIREDLMHVTSIFEGGEQGALSRQLKDIASTLGRNAAFIPELESLSARVSEVRIELKDIEDEVSSRSAMTVTSPQRLEEVEGRLALIYELMRKYSVQDVAELIAVRDGFAAELSVGDSLQESRDALAARSAELRADCESKAAVISEARASAAPSLSERIQQSVRSLEMPLARFEVSVLPRGEWNREGGDDISFRFSANGSQDLLEIGRCASGGEMSRVMLCLKDLISRYREMPTMIFDEIDTGVSGSIAHKMGQMIVSLASRMQVFAITHLPQVASRGNAHFLVQKLPDAEGRPHTGICRIEGEERVREIARMLSGSTLTPEALSNARVLLNEK